MSEFLRGDKVTHISFGEVTLALHPSWDFIHHWPQIGAYMLKVMDFNSTPPCMRNISVTPEQARRISGLCDLEIVFRAHMGVQEHEMWLDWSSEQLLEDSTIMDPEDGQGEDKVDS